jgi:hypothetical protein
MPGCLLKIDRYLCISTCAENAVGLTPGLLLSIIFSFVEGSVAITKNLSNLESVGFAENSMRFQAKRFQLYKYIFADL